MSYTIMKCEVCGRPYHLHDNGKVTGAGAGEVPCSHVVDKYSRRKVNATEVDVAELEELIHDNVGD